ncbi:MAG TPA: hypothetical protein VK476_07580, partial [Flavobacterium sp.]|nr:hypothetical protein [Flavobacterium sp.]
DMIWTSVSALYQEYVLLAYHYGLLTLSNDAKFNFPGILIMDFPPQLGEEKIKLDTLDYIIKPFIDFCSRPENANIQVIFAGKAISDLPSTSINTLTNIWISSDNSGLDAPK